MKLSIIIPNYNDAKFIPQCLDSLINQKLNSDEFEIIIVKSYKIMPKNTQNIKLKS